MKAHAWGLGIAAVLFCGSSMAQQAEGERPPRPDSASNAAIGGWCDALTGAKKEECLRDERRRQEEKKKGASTRGSCDRLVGPERQGCLRQGGTLEVDAKSSAGASARASNSIRGYSTGSSGSPGAGSYGGSSGETGSVGGSGGGSCLCGGGCFPALIRAVAALRHGVSTPPARSLS